MNSFRNNVRLDLEALEDRECPSAFGTLSYAAPVMVSDPEQIPVARVAVISPSAAACLGDARTYHNDYATAFCLGDAMPVSSYTLTATSFRAVGNPEIRTTGNPDTSIAIPIEQFTPSPSNDLGLNLTSRGMILDY